MTEHVRDMNDHFDSWISAFDMVQNDKGDWTWKAFFVQGDEWFFKYQDLLRQWNKFVPKYNASVSPQNVGRPCQASEAQQGHVLKLRKSGMSLRNIAEETNLGCRLFAPSSVRAAAQIEPQSSACNGLIQIELPSEHGRPRRSPGSHCLSR
jgi:hypothetical protein